MLTANIMGFECEMAFVIHTEENCAIFEKDAKHYGILVDKTKEKTEAGDTVYFLDDYTDSSLFSNPKVAKSRLLSEFLKHLHETNEWIAEHRNKGEGMRMLIFFNLDTVEDKIDKVEEERLS